MGVPHLPFNVDINIVDDPGESLDGSSTSSCNDSTFGTVLNRRHFVRLVSFSSTYYTLALHQKRLVQVYHFVYSVTIGRIFRDRDECCAWQI
jgi:hypothetical protein